MGEKVEARRQKVEWRRILCVCGTMALTALVALPQGSAERALEAAIHEEAVAGDLKGAIEKYREIVARKDTPKPIAANALLHMGECYEKLGLRRQAHESYTRVVRDFESESAAAQARAKIDSAEML